MRDWRRWGIGLVAVVALGFLIWPRVTHDWKKRTYRIGWEIDPPEQLRGDDGGPTGFAVELVREAAERRGIGLTWVYRQESSEAALRGGAVDLWPLMTVTPERARVVHISAPFLETAFCLLVRGDHAARRMSDLVNRRIGYSGMPINFDYLKRYVPGAREVVQAPNELMRSLCTRDIDAAFLEEHVAITMLLGGGACAGQALRIIPTNGPRVQLGVGSTFESAAAADAIRNEIGQMAAEGRLPALLAKWGFLTGRSEESITMLLDARRRERMLWISVAVFALLGAFALWQAQQLRRTNTALAGELAERTRHENEIRSLTARLINAQEEERGRLARELHDDLCQQIAALSIAMGNLKRHLPVEEADVRGQSDRIQQRLVQTAETVRGISHQLHPAALEHSGLAPALAAYCEEFGSLTGIRVALETHGSFDGISPFVALNLFRITQEALQNVAKHAKVKEAMVSLRRSQEWLCLTIADLGVGMPPMKPGASGGLGLVSIKERIRLVSVTVEISSKRNEGTAMVIRIPSAAVGTRAPA